MNVLDAARHLARRFKGGIDAVATRMPTSNSKSASKSADVLRHELAGTGTNKFGLEDADLLTQLAVEQRVPDPLAILNAMAANAGGLVVMLPQVVDADDMTIAGLAAFAKEFSDVVNAMAEAVADGEVTANELARVDKELGELMARAQAMRAHLAHMHEARKPASKAAA